MPPTATFGETHSQRKQYSSSTQKSKRKSQELNSNWLRLRPANTSTIHQMQYQHLIKKVNYNNYVLGKEFYIKDRGQRPCYDRNFRSSQQNSDLKPSLWTFKM